jgi:hypothetical protein
MIRAFGPVRSTMLTALVPGLSATGAVIFLGEPLGLNLVAGLALVTIGILVGVRAAARGGPPAAAADTPDSSSGPASVATPGGTKQSIARKAGGAGAAIRSPGTACGAHHVRGDHAHDTVQARLYCVSLNRQRESVSCHTLRCSSRSRAACR